jgi:hypothetical protein
MHVCVTTTQSQPEPESAVTVRLGGGASVTVTVPCVGDPPTFITLIVNVIACPGITAAAAGTFVIVRSAPSSGEAITVGSDAVLLALFGSPPPATVAMFVTVPGAVLAATIAVTVMTG